MPLPPALLARLAKRGIVEEEEKAEKPDPSEGSAKPGGKNGKFLVDTRAIWIAHLIVFD